MDPQVGANETEEEILYVTLIIRFEGTSQFTIPHLRTNILLYEKTFVLALLIHY